MPSNKLIASLSLDLDNKWSYMKTHGDTGWELFPSYLETVVPRILSFLEERRLKITFFIVGQDAAIPKNEDVLRSIAAAGHEIGNHSFAHEPWLNLYSKEQLEAEFDKAEAHIERVTGRRTAGFRGPGFSFSREVLELLARRGYKYDASTFPTFIGPLARMYYFMVSRLKPTELEQRKALFGSFAEVFRRNKPYVWQLAEGSLIEIPVTTMPLLRLPIHLSYVLYLATFSQFLALFYFRVFLWLCRLIKITPSLLLHPLDFIGGDECPELAFFPAMSMTGEAKLAMAAQVVHLYAERFRITTMEEHAAAVQNRPCLSVASFGAIRS